MAIASYSSTGIFCAPAMKSARHRPRVTHEPTSPTAGNAQLKLASHAWAWLPSPTQRSSWLMKPPSPYIHCHITATATGGNTWGTKRIARVNVHGGRRGPVINDVRKSAIRIGRTQK